MSVEPHEIQDATVVPDRSSRPAQELPEEVPNVDIQDDVTSNDEEWLEDDIEQQYLQALQAVEDVEHRVNATVDLNLAETQREEAGDSGEESSPNGTSRPLAVESDDSPHSGQPSVTPRQIVEAALFVGGTPLTLKRISMLLRNEFDHDFIEQTIDSLNLQYAEEQRPYEITFGEGGYRLALRPDFERLRSRAYGFGPKEVKLSQDALEVLALIAYRQPASAADVEKAGKSKPGSILRLLVRRQLVEIERVGKARDDIKYRTTQRFLELFGMKDLDELPQSDEDLDFR